MEFRIAGSSRVVHADALMKKPENRIIDLCLLSRGD